MPSLATEMKRTTDFESQTDAHSDYSIGTSSIHDQILRWFIAWSLEEAKVKRSRAWQQDRTPSCLRSVHLFLDTTFRDTWSISESYRAIVLVRWIPFSWLILEVDSFVQVTPSSAQHIRLNRDRTWLNCFDFVEIKSTLLYARQRDRRAK